MARNPEELHVPAPHAHGHRPRSVAVRKSFRQLVRRRRSAQRRGVILLVTLVLLTLFTMMLITFVVTTVTSRQGMMGPARVEQTGDSPEAIMYDAFLQVIRGPRNPNSPIGAHSILEDMLGSDSMVLNIPSSNVVQVTTTAGPLNSPIVQISWTYSPPTNPYPKPTQLPPPTGHYAGRTIMLLNGSYSGEMGRIIGSDFDGTTHTLSLYGFSPSHFTVSPTRFLVNGKPFSGTGFGFKPLSYDPTAPNASNTTNPTYTRLLDAYWLANDGNSWTLPMQQALLPNHRQNVFAGMVDPLDTTPAGFLYSQYTDPAGPGGANEDHDIADFQNFHLSVSMRDNNSMETILPSFHRPDLLWYWANQVAAVPAPSMGIQHQLLPPLFIASPNNVDPLALRMLRKVMVRPLPWDHPNFTGSNPAMALGTVNALPASISHPFIAGPWDVDNDNDGETDSIWMDVGLPVQTAPDGRRYKPLMAIMVRDMDGRLNLNAHSSWRHVPSGSNQISRFLPVQIPFALPLNATAQTGPFRLRVGQGYGPAEISLSPIFSPYSGPTSENFSVLPYTVTEPVGELKKILGGDATINLDGRYGERDAGTAFTTIGGAGLPGISLVDEPFSWLTESQFPRSGIVAGYQKQYPYLPLPIGSINGPFNIDVSNQILNIGYTGSPDHVWVRASGYGTPPDLNANGMLALDLRGAPIYADYTFLGGAGTPDAGFGEANEVIDDPYEIDLSLASRGGAYTATTYLQSTSGGIPSTATFNANALAGSSYSSSIDAPFTTAELERIMRAGDVDASTLPDRLLRLAPFTFTNPQTGQLAPSRLRQLLTVDQYDMATPGMAFAANDMVQEIYATSKVMNTAAPSISDNTIATVLRARLLLENSTAYPNGNPLPQATTQAIAKATKQLLPADLLMGQKFDINRLLGNGRDDNQNGVVDEPGELETAWNELYPTPVTFDLNNDGLDDGKNPIGARYQDFNGDGVFDSRDMPFLVDQGTPNVYDPATDVYAALPRQLLARHLYVLMMLLKDPNFVVTADTDGNGLTGNAAVPITAGTMQGTYTVRASEVDTAYYFAQLAINMVDFRDRDAIMTPFEFDIFPFRKDDAYVAGAYVQNPNLGTWEVDGVLTSTMADGTVIGSADDVLPYRGLVWGCERPELLITETMATHDRRTRDTNQDEQSPAGSGQTGVVDRAGSRDSDFDQVRRPLGTVMVELFNPNPPFSTGNKFAGEAPNELYSVIGNTDAMSGIVTPTRDAAGNQQFGVNLSKVTPLVNDPVGQRASPVWRLVTLKNGVTPATRKPMLDRASIDRIVHFVNSTPPPGATKYWAETSPQIVSFIAQPANLVSPGSYAVIAPAAFNVYATAPANVGKYLMTPLGMRSTAGDLPADPRPSDGATTSVLDSYPRLLVLSNSVNATDIGVCNNAYTLMADKSSIKQTIGVWVAPNYYDSVNAPIANPTAATPAAKSVRFSLTEPDFGYPIVTNILNPPAGAPLAEMYKYNENGFYDAAVRKYPTTPYDLRTSLFNANGGNPYDTTQRLNTWQLPDATKQNKYTTIAQASFVCLQRLANPLQPWDASANPYITVDQMPVDLTLFNSEMQTAAAPQAGNQEFTTDDIGTSAWTFDTRRRSAANSPVPNRNNIWFQGNIPPSARTPVGQMINGGVNFMTQASLGYLNNEYGIPGNNRWTSSTAPVTIPGTPTPPNTVDPLEYKGDPTTPFPWLNWNNRPYVSSKEMLLVPTSTPSSLLSEITLNQTLRYGGMLGNPFQQAVTGTLPAAEFGHLANVFDSPLTQTAPPNVNGTPVLPSARLYRLFDFVHVPSRYTGTVDWIPPGNVSGASSAAHSLHPPFNQVSRFRDPGKVNINTIYDPAVWQGILDERLAADQGLNPPWLKMYQAMWMARQGSGDSTMFTAGGGAFATRQTLLAPTTNAPYLPTIFAKPFRSAVSNSLVPIPQMRFNHAVRDTNEREVSSTLFRPDPLAGSFVMLEAPGAPAPGSGIFKEFPNSAPVSTGTSPYFAYEELRRLDNLVTTRSNVYAVWITMGYFEVTPAPATSATDPDYAAKYPDGWQLGAELGSDTGDIQRHRSFYIYDRSIPVGFERGENHNVDRGILVERYIE